MKVSIGGLVLVVAFAIGLGPLAQAQAPAGAPAPHDMTGCLAKSGDKFQLTNWNAETRPPVDIAESTANLAPHVGHKITITGTRDASAPGHTMKVTAMKMVAGTCP